ncbi:MAG TPA: glycosyltransferase [Pirellulales bacterium]|nr:glycosyltransferase [Pirellulales bacterium]
MESDNRVVDPPQRLALCITELEVGGAERCLVELATRIDRTRFAPVVYALSPRPGAGERTLLAQLDAAGIETHFLGARGARDFPHAVQRLAGLFKQQRPAVVQSFLFHANFVARWAAWFAGVPHVLSGVRVAEQGVAWHLWLDRATRWLVERYVCVSHDVACFTRERLGLSEGRVTVIPNGIDYDRLSSAPAADLTAFGLEAGRKVVTYVGRLEPQKGVLELIESCRQWLDRLPGHALLLVGAGPLEAKLRENAEQLNVGRRIHFAGWRMDVAQIMKASDVVVLPSRWEGMPNVILEAMAVGKAVVSTDVEGVRELLGEEAGEQIAPRGDYRQFAERIAALAADDARREQLAASNQLQAKRFCWQSMVAAYERLFTEVAR